MRGLAWLLLALLLAGCAVPGAGLHPASVTQAPALSCPAPCVRLLSTSARPWEPTIAVDPRDPGRVVVANAVFEGLDGTPVATSWIETHATNDGGASWTSTRMPPLGMHDAMGDAFVAFLRDGTPLAAGLAFDHAGAGAGQAYASARSAYSFFVARSSDGGASWEGPAVVRAGQGALALALAPQPVGEQAAAAAWDANDKEWIAEGPDGTLLATWADIRIIDPPQETVSRQDLVAATSRDGGRTWSTPSLVETGGQWLGAAPAILPDGTMAVAYVDALSLDLHVATSRDGGATWRAQPVGSAAFFPALAASGARLVLAYADSDERAPDVVQMDGKPQRVVVRVSDDAGATWSAPRTVDAPEAPGRATPRLAIAPDGTALLSWMHATSAGAELRVVAMRGDSISTPLALDRPQAPSSLLGDYMGLAGTPDGAWAAWVTSADGKEFRLAVAQMTFAP